MATPNTPTTGKDMSLDELKKLMGDSGYHKKPEATEGYNRIKVQGSNLVFEDEIIASYNAKTKEPMLYVKLAAEPTEYQSMWFEESLAMAVGRPEIAGKFCRSHFAVPSQAQKYAEDGTSCGTCPVQPKANYNELPQEAKNQSGAKKCGWKGDVEFNILDKDEEGTPFVRDNTIYKLSLPTTGIIEFVGSNSRKSDPAAGSVSPENFMTKLARLGVSKWGREGVSKGKDALAEGAVIAEIRTLPTSSADGKYNYNVVSFNPIEIVEYDTPVAIETTQESVTVEDPDEVPF